MSIADSLFGLLGIGKDPTEQILAASAPAPAAAPATPGASGGAGTPGGVAGQPATAAPGAAPASGSTPPAAPPDLGTLYAKLLREERARNNIDSGMTLLAAGFASPENRAALVNMAAGQSGKGTSPAATLQTILQLQEAQRKNAANARLQGNVAAIAQKFGWDATTVQTLLDTGKLDEVIKESMKPDRQVVTKGDGSIVIVDKSSSKEIGQISGPRGSVHVGPRGEINVVSGDQTSATTIKPGEVDKTGDMKDWEQVNRDRSAAGKPILDYESYLKQRDEQRSKTTTISESGQSAAIKKLVDDMSTEYGNARSHLGTVGQVQQARSLLNQGIIAGSRLSPAELEGRKMLGSLFGIPDARLGTTEAFNSAMKEIVLPKVKALGTGNSISNADVQFIQDAVGSNNLTPDGIKRILNAMEIGSALEAGKHNAEVDRFAQTDKETAKYLRKVDVGSINPELTRRIPEQAIKILRDKPETVELFNQRYGQGGKLGQYILMSR